MTVTYGTDAMSLLKVCGVELTESLGVKLKHDGMEFSCPDGNGESTFVPMKMSEVKKLVSSSVSHQIKMIYQQLFTHAANKCCEGAVVSNGSVKEEGLVKILDKPSPSVIVPKETVKATLIYGKAKTEGKLGKGETVPLKMANKMYQPTKGTGDVSVYWCVGASPQEGIRVAARWLGDKLSMRVEGDFSHEVKSTMTEIGLQACNGGHWSLHVKIPKDNLVLARKTAASVLMGLGVSWDTPFPNMALIQGKGT